MRDPVLDSALRRAVEALIPRQSASGEWEGKVGDPMLAAHYVLMCRITRSAIPAARSPRFQAEDSHV